MNSNWAEENLQTIRTLMERSALYRRALAPIMIFAGTLGVMAATIGLLLHVDTVLTFDALWIGTATIAVIGAFLNARRQAIKDKEKIWSPPTRRVAQALSLPLTVGLFLSALPIFFGTEAPSEFNTISALVWILFYGCALHSAGFFMPRGIKCFGLVFVASALGFIVVIPIWSLVDISPHWLMGFFFGVLHLAYGAYLYLTEKGKNAA